MKHLSPSLKAVMTAAAFALVGCVPPVPTNTSTATATGTGVTTSTRTSTTSSTATATARNCVFNGLPLASGASVTAYHAASGAACVSQLRTCNDGLLSGSYAFPACTVLPPVPPAPPTAYKAPPAGPLSWDWQIGAGSDSNILPPAGAKLMDVDVFSTSAAKVAQMKAQGIYTVCYINAGSYQPGLPDSAQYPAALKLQADPDWPGEYFLDVTDVFKTGSVLAAILNNRLKLCKDKGFDAVEPDNLQNDENIRGGLITTQQQLDFNGWIADAAHAHGLAVLQKNGPDKILLKDKTGKAMVEKFDGILNEECQQYSECAPLAEYVKRGKPALNVEYTRAPDCALAKKLGITTMERDLGLVGPNMKGYNRVVCP